MRCLALLVGLALTHAVGTSCARPALAAVVADRNDPSWPAVAHHIRSAQGSLQPDLRRLAHKIRRTA